jgi:hypothetical protein
MQNEEHPFFLHAPAHLLQERVKLVVPALATLLSGAAGHMRRDLLPLLGANVGDQRHQFGVLHVVPGSLARSADRLV